MWAKRMRSKCKRMSLVVLCGFSVHCTRHFIEKSAHLHLRRWLHHHRLALLHHHRLALLRHHRLGRLWHHLVVATALAIATGPHHGACNHHHGEQKGQRAASATGGQGARLLVRAAQLAVNPVLRCVRRERAWRRLRRAEVVAAAVAIAVAAAARRAVVVARVATIGMKPPAPVAREGERLAHHRGGDEAGGEAASAPPGVGGRTGGAAVTTAARIAERSAAPRSAGDAERHRGHHQEAQHSATAAVFCLRMTPKSPTMSDEAQTSRSQ